MHLAASDALIGTLEWHPKSKWSSCLENTLSSPQLKRTISKAHSPLLCFHSLRERDPNDPMLATLKSKPNTSGVMYDENGERAYPRLTSSTPGASQPEPDFKPSDQARSVRRSEFDQPSESGKKELDGRDGLRERIRADLERRRQRIGGAGMGGEADPDLSGRTGEGAGGQTGEGAWWERKEQAAQREGEWGDAARGKGTSQGRPDLQSRSEVRDQTLVSGRGVVLCSVCDNLVFVV